jgi:tetratricopeptide (TPR) repeat protein
LTAPHNYSEAERDLSSAIGWLREDTQESHLYYKLRGTAFRKLPGRIEEAIKDYETALRSMESKAGDPKFAAEMAYIHKKLSLAYILKKSQDPAIAKADQALAKLHNDRSVSYYQTPRDKAAVKENLGLLYLTTGEWARAFDSTTDATNIYSDTPWNWIIRYIAARQVADKQAADQAYKTWLAMGQPNDLANLYDYIPQLLKDHLGVKLVQEDRLEGTPTLRTTFGTSIVKSHPIRLSKGKRYLVDMESAVLDSYLILLDGNGRIVDEDDDRGGGRNARIDFTPKEDGDYTILATSFGGQAQGAYALIVRELTAGRTKGEEK